MTGDTVIVYRELNTRWLRLFATVTPFTGQACSFTALISNRDACLRAKSLLEEYDRFQVPFPESQALKKVIAALRKEIPSFLDAFPTSIQRLSALYWKRYKCLCHYVLRVRCDVRFVGVRAETCYRKLESYENAYQQVVELGERYGLVMSLRAEIMDASLHRLRIMRFR